MANNRLAFVCTVCVGEEGTQPEDCFFYALKYYPATGWYVNREEDSLKQFGADLNTWLDKHKHGDVLGEYLIILPERYLSEQAAAATELLLGFGKFLQAATDRGGL